MSTTTGEKLLTLADGRTIAYAENGSSSSSTLVLFLHGAFGIGTAKRIPPVFVEKDVLFLAPTIPGWGNSSSIPSTFPTFAAGFASDMTTLIKHVSKASQDERADFKLYVAGGSYGTVHAQMLYLADYDVFPLGKHIAGLLLLAPMSSPRCHKDYAKALPWSSWVSIGPPARYLPFNIIPRLTKLIMQPKLSSLANAERFIRTFLFDSLDAGEKEVYRKWREANGMAEGELEREMAENNLKSVSRTWQGALDIPAVVHSDWGRCPSELDEQHSRPPVLIYTATGDEMLAGATATWLASSYRNARLEEVEGGGHISALFRLDSIWAELLKDA